MRKLIAVVFSLFVSLASAQTPVQLVITGAVGNGADTAGRFFAPILEKHLNRPVVVMNKPGGNGVIGLQYADSEWKTNDLILVGSSTMGLVSFLKQMNFDPHERFVPVHGMSQFSGAIYASAKTDIHDAKGMVEHFKKTGRLLVASTGQIDDVSIWRLGEVLGIPVEVVRYKSANQLALELAAGVADITIASVGAGAYEGLVNSGLLRTVAIIDDSANASLPKVKTLKQQGFQTVPGFRWTALFLPKDMPAERRLPLENAIIAAMNSPEAAEYEKRAGAPKQLSMGSAQVRSMQAREVEVFRRLWK